MPHVDFEDLKPIGHVRPAYEDALQPAGHRHSHSKAEYLGKGAVTTRLIDGELKWCVYLNDYESTCLVRLPDGYVFECAPWEIEPVEERASALSKRRRFLVLRRDEYRCQMCGRDASDGVKLEVDHIHPRSKGGTNEMSNLQTLCKDCNRGKSDLPM